MALLVAGSTGNLPYRADGPLLTAAASIREKVFGSVWHGRPRRTLSQPPRRAGSNPHRPLKSVVAIRAPTM